MRIPVLLFPDSMPLTLHLRLLVASPLLLLLCSSTSCLGTQYQDCPQHDTFMCGNYEFGYPFGKNGSGCGESDFQLYSCEPDSVPLINIGGNEYYIWNFSYSPSDNKSGLVTIANENMWDHCNLSRDYSQFWMSASSFRINADVYTNFSLWNDCSNQATDDYISRCGTAWYYGLSSPLPPCKSIQLPFAKSFVLGLNPQQLESDLKKGFEISWYDDKCPNGKSRQDNCTGRGRNKSAIIIGCSIGGAALLAIAVLLSLTCYAKRRKRPPPPRSSISKVEEFLKEYAYEMPTRYSQSELKKMTNNFAEKLGEGGYGVVYKGKLRNGALVAVKLLDRHRHSQTQFMNEVATIGRVHHINLVRLFGYCFESFTSALVYEYMVNGSLEKLIFAGKEKGQVLRWEQLSSIALGAARGIAYLHQDCEKRIIHFDIKPHNILLGSEFTPKVADFGLAELCGKGEDHISMTGVRGTPGYVAPEVWSRDLGPVTDKSDVYSFGMLLLEIVGGRKNIDVQASPSSQLYFPEWVLKLLESGELGMRMRGGEMEVENAEKARRLTKVGLWCIQYNDRDRPCMSGVVQMLEGNEDVASPPLPFNSSAEPENALPSSTLTSSIEIRLETGLFNA